IKPLAATLVSASMFTHVDPLVGAVMGMATGGVAAGAVHVVKTKTRLASSLLTAGFGNPFLSILEDIAAAISIAMAILIPLFAAAAIAFVFVGLAGLLLLRRSRRVARPVAAI
ncbi:MAG TPA: DUF4126 domain-containing protein, partial [bacterium]|nr:DUF4126 domain-containing protein [bacterium]